MPRFETLLILLLFAFRVVHAREVIVMGDLHGDYKVLSDMLVHLNLTRGEGDIRETFQLGHDQEFLQTGDVLDRGPNGLQILNFLREQIQQNNNVDMLLGNHELMNMYGEFSFVNRDELNDEYERLMLEDDSQVRNFLIKRHVIRVIDGVVYTHAGLVPYFVDKYIQKDSPNEPLDIAYRMNEAFANILRHGSFGIHTHSHKSLLGPSGPLWTRKIFSDCGSLYKTLELLGAKHMVVGHTPQDEVSIHCQDSRRGMSLIAIDTGMSRAYGGVPSAVKIVDGKTMYVFNNSSKIRMVELETGTEVSLDFEHEKQSSYFLTNFIYTVIGLVIVLVVKYSFSSTNPRLILKKVQ